LDEKMTTMTMFVVKVAWTRRSWMASLLAGKKIGLAWWHVSAPRGKVVEVNVDNEGRSDHDIRVWVVVLSVIHTHSLSGRAGDI
jgi:hypothetical protein